MIRHYSSVYRFNLYVYCYLMASISLFFAPKTRLQAQQASVEKKSKIIFLGDSITAGYGVAKPNAYPALLETKLKKENLNGFKIINGGISGSTSASGLSRLKWQLKGKPNYIIIALGANDGLRGTQVNETKKNLEEIIILAKKNQLQVLLAGMMMPPNYGKQYREDFSAIFPALAKKHKVLLMPFLLDGVAGEPKLNQSDGIHPNEAGHKIIAEKMWPYLKQLLN